MKPDPSGEHGLAGPWCAKPGRTGRDQGQREKAGGCGGGVGWGGKVGVEGYLKRVDEEAIP